MKQGRSKPTHNRKGIAMAKRIIQTHWNGKKRKLAGIIAGATGEENRRLKRPISSHFSVIGREKRRGWRLKKEIWRMNDTPWGASCFLSEPLGKNTPLWGKFSLKGCRVPRLSGTKNGRASWLWGDGLRNVLRGFHVPLFLRYLVKVGTEWLPWDSFYTGVKLKIENADIRKERLYHFTDL